MLTEPPENLKRIIWRERLNKVRGMQMLTSDDVICLNCGYRLSEHCYSCTSDSDDKIYYCNDGSLPRFQYKPEPLGPLCLDQEHYVK